ncbi:phage tail protein [Gordonia sp. CPCC 206044]|uniref:phage tail protein n=1 Tax=Gordonia sp. CPCC 206044 TaxID=3140793 RepID=UPI003AF3B98E
MRGELPEVLSPFPVGATLPSIYIDDPCAQGLCAVFDRMLAPVLAVLDSFPAHLDPGTAPDDSLSWLAAWIGLVLDGHESADKKRELISAGAELLRWRGTVRGVRDAITAAFGVVPEIAESGGVTTSAEPTGPPQEQAAPLIVVTLVVDDPDTIDRQRLDGVVARVKPAHLPHRVEVVAR